MTGEGGFQREDNSLVLLLKELNARSKFALQKNCQHKTPRQQQTKVQAELIIGALKNWREENVYSKTKNNYQTREYQTRGENRIGQVNDRRCVCVCAISKSVVQRPNNNNNNKK